MASRTELSNISLAHISNKEIADIDTEVSEEARACRVFYSIALLAVLRDFYWPFATRTKALTLVAEEPTSEWRFSYRYPSDCVKIKRILSGYRNDTRQSRVSYVISNDDVGSLILTDMAEASAEYTVNNVSTERFPPDFSLAFSYRLASYLSSKVTAGDPFKLKTEMLQHYQLEVSRAKANARNEQQVDEEPSSEFERARL